MPIVITDGLVLSEADAAIPLTYPRILSDDIFGLSTATLTASSELTGFEKENAVDYLTYDFWQPSSLPGWLAVELPEAQTVDYMMIAAHSLATSGVAVRPQYHNGVDWTDLAAETAPGTDDVLAFLFEEVFTNRVRVYITGQDSPDIPPSLGVVMAGKALKMQRGLSLDHLPPSLARKTELRPNDSESGQWLGRSIRRQGIETVLKFNYLTADFIRDAEFDTFRLRARTHPFGFLWSPVTYPDDIAYCRCDVDIRPVLAGMPDRMNVEFPIKGLLE